MGVMSSLIYEHNLKIITLHPSKFDNFEALLPEVLCQRVYGVAAHRCHFLYGVL